MHAGVSFLGKTRGLGHVATTRLGLAPPTLGGLFAGPSARSTQHAAKSAMAHRRLTNHGIHGRDTQGAPTVSIRAGVCSSRRACPCMHAGEAALQHVGGHRAGHGQSPLGGAEKNINATRTVSVNRCWTGHSRAAGDGIAFAIGQLRHAVAVGSLDNGDSSKIAEANSTRPAVAERCGCSAGSAPARCRDRLER